MDVNSTQHPDNSATLPKSKRSVPQAGPKKSTLDFIRQFARIYVPLGNMPGIIMN